MRIALIADVFAPQRTSGAVQLRDLAKEFVRQGHDCTVLVPQAAELSGGWSLEDHDGVSVLRLKAMKTKDVSYVRRLIGETLMPYNMQRNFNASPIASVKWDIVIWYSPSIFLGPLVANVKKQSECRSYLILRDIFPQWALDMELMKKGPLYWYFKRIENYQYSVADVIGVQSRTNLSYFERGQLRANQRVEVLQNWLEEAPNIGCDIDVGATTLAGRRIFVYAGNMGVAQGMDILIDLAKRLQVRKDVGFLFVGRGRDASRLRKEAAECRLDNVAFFDEIDPRQIAGLYAQCKVGLVTLDPRHKTQNIPGKFLSYMRAGLPVLARVNNGNDLANMIGTERVGRVCTANSVEKLVELAESLLEEIDQKSDLNRRCKSLADRFFSPEAAARQILGSAGVPT